MASSPIWRMGCDRHGGMVNAVRLSQDGRVAVSTGDDWAVRVWDVENATVRWVLDHGHGAEVEDVALSADGRVAVSGGWDFRLCIWDTLRGELRYEIDEAQFPEIMGIALTADGRLAVSSSGHALRLWNLRKRTCLGDLANNLSEACSIDLSADGRRLAVAETDIRAILLDEAAPGRIWLMDVGGSWERRVVHAGDVLGISMVAFTRDGTRLLSGGYDRTVRLWNVGSGECLAALAGHESSIRCVAVDAEGRLAVSGDIQGTIRIWDLMRGSETHAFHHGEWLTSVALRSDSVVAGDVKGTVLFGDLRGTRIG
jgi:WD40 repeat protein